MTFGCSEDAVAPLEKIFSMRDERILGVIQKVCLEVEPSDAKCSFIEVAAAELDYFTAFVLDMPVAYTLPVPSRKRCREQRCEIAVDVEVRLAVV